LGNAIGFSLERVVRSSNGELALERKTTQAGLVSAPRGSVREARDSRRGGRLTLRI
jgi:hypothetical protein